MALAAGAIAAAYVSYRYLSSLHQTSHCCSNSQSGSSSNCCDTKVSSNNCCSSDEKSPQSSCCSKTPPTARQPNGEQTKQTVREHYSQVAVSQNVAVPQASRVIAQAFGYSDEELSVIPEGANLGLSCGNPTAIASLKPGEVVVDLGSGGGMDVFIAAKRVGNQGRVIGIDMTSDMIELAKRNLIKKQQQAREKQQQSTGQQSQSECRYDNVEFHLSDIENMLVLTSNTVDCVISNCVLNLVPNKLKAFKEIYRVLKPGGRLAVSDMALKKDLPVEIRDDVYAYSGCISGALSIPNYYAQLKSAGFSDVHIVDAQVDLNAYKQLAGEEGSESVPNVACVVSCCAPSSSSSSSSASTSTSASSSSCCGPSTSAISSSCCAPKGEEKGLAKGMSEALQKFEINDYVASVKVYAVKA